MLKRGVSARHTFDVPTNKGTVALRVTSPTVLTRQSTTLPTQQVRLSRTAPTSTLKKVNKAPVAEKRVQIKLSILMIAKIKRMAARVKKQYLAKHPQLGSTKVLQMENSYQMGPGEGEHPMVNQVESLLEYVVNFFFDDVKSYAPSLAARLAQSAADDILRKAQNRLHCPRYKMVSYVTIVQRQDDDGGSAIASRCVWDDRLDMHASFTQKIPGMYITATLYALYFE